MKNKRTSITHSSVSFLFLLVLLFVATGCEDETQNVDTEKKITEFVFKSAKNSTLSIDITATISDTIITFIVPAGTDITTLTPTITTPKNVTVTPASNQAQDFTNPVQYTVTAPDKTTRQYSISVTITKYEQVDIVAFGTSIMGQAVRGIVYNEVIMLAGAFNEPVYEAIITEMQLSPNATANRQVGDVLVFQDNISTITVTAENGVTLKQYTLVPVDTTTQVTSFKFEKKNNINAYTSLHDSDTIIEGKIDYITKKIHLVISPYLYEFNPTTLVATFETTLGASAYVAQDKQISEATPNDFTNDVVYTITSSNTNNSEEYTVILTKTSQATIPDDKFRAYLKNLIPASFNEDGKMDVTHITTEDHTSMNVALKGISSLKGIEFFTDLTRLYCRGNQLEILNLSKNKNLEILSCYNNKLTHLIMSENRVLTKLWCYSNQLDSLNVSKNSALTTLSCHNNDLTHLEVGSNTMMEILSCKDNQLTYLNISSVKGVDLLIINAGEMQNELKKNPITELSVNIAMKNNSEIKEAKNNLEDNVVITVYDSNGNLSCYNYNPNTGNCN